MARLWSSGLELNTTSSNVEGLTVSGTNSIVTSVVRSGSYGFRTNPTTSAGLGNYIFQSSDASGVFFGRVYLRIASLPTSDTEVCTFFSAGALGHKVGIRITTTGVAQLRNIEDSAQVGSDGPTLSTNTWYLVELKIDTSTLSSTVVEGKIDGTSFASGTINLANHVNRFTWGVQTSATADFYFDDVAVNSNSGSFQNSWPGSGKIIHLKPNAAGDNSDWSDDYTFVDEVTPDDGTSLVSSNTLDQIDDHNLELPAVLGTSDTINVVQVGVRFNGAGASANASFVLRIKASASGTVEESGAITPSNTTWVTNAAAAPRNYSLTLYDLPGASTTAWTKADLETAQIGYRLSATSTNAAQISTVWALVDYTPAGTYFGSASTNSSTTGTAVSVSAPSDVVTGDVVIVSVHANGNTTIVDNNGATPFTEDINDYQPNASSGHTVSVFSRRIQNGDPTTYNFTIGASGRWSVIAASFHNPHASDIYDVSPSTSNATAVNDTASADITAPTITTTTTNANHVVCAYWDTANFASSTQPSGYWKIGEINNQPQGMAVKVIDSASATGGQLYTSSESNPRMALSFAIKDVNAGGGGGDPTPFAYPRQRMRMGFGA